MKQFQLFGGALRRHTGLTCLACFNYPILFQHGQSFRIEECLVCYRCLPQRLGDCIAPGERGYVRPLHKSGVCRDTGVSYFFFP
jgi:hypothetical protein